MIISLARMNVQQFPRSYRIEFLEKKMCKEKHKTPIYPQPIEREKNIYPKKRTKVHKDNKITEKEKRTPPPPPQRILACISRDPMTLGISVAFRGVENLGE